MPIAISTGSATYDFKPAPPHIMGKVRRLATVCNSHGVGLTAAALQLSQVARTVDEIAVHPGVRPGTFS